MPTPDQTEQEEPLLPERDFYLENGYLVFTEYFLLKRGTCCGSGCRHCPYRKPRQSTKKAKS